MMLVLKLDGWYSNRMKVKKAEMDRVSIEIGSDGKVPSAAVLQGSMYCSRREK